MSGIFGDKLKISIFGESHGEAIGITINNLPSGIKLDMDFIEKEMARRAPGGRLATPRKEADKVEIISGLFNGITTGNPLTGIIYNSNTKSKDYELTKDLMRPSHSDFGYYVKQDGFNDYRGGGHSSGRITAPLVFCGAICKQLLLAKGIKIAAHITSIKDVKDEKFSIDKIENQFNVLETKDIKVINDDISNKMLDTIENAMQNKDSVGGTIECAVMGLKPGVGDPFFDSIESTLAHLLFSVPAVKGVEFGLGFDITKMFGSECNDEFYYDENKNVRTKTNNNGGILGGISNGMPIVFSVAIKPTASIFKEQNTINVKTKENETITIKGRHDPCIALRAVPCIEAVAAIAMCEYDYE